MERLEYVLRLKRETHQWSEGSEATETLRREPDEQRPPSISVSRPPLSTTAPPPPQFWTWGLRESEGT